MESLIEVYEKFRPHPSANEIQFLTALEITLPQDLWQSAGGHWSQASIQKFRETAMLHLSQILAYDPTPTELQQKWTQIVRDFHQNYWNEQRLAKKEKLPLTAQQKITREMASYLIVLLQTTFITKTIILYFGLHSHEGDDNHMMLWLILAVAFTVFSLTFFAFRKYIWSKDE